jgi:hypothetical protein
MGTLFQYIRKPKATAMRIFLIIFFAAFLLSCNSSSKKDPNKAMDDTARMDNPPNSSTPVSIAPVKIATSEIPATIKVKGTVQEVWKWTDNLGENILITSSVAPHEEKSKDGEEGQSAEIHAFHYAKKDGDYTQVWMMNDAEKLCPVDITCDFIPGSATVTDLDKDGIAEIKVQYSVACRGDVSPATMKLIMYENGVKYALRGNMWIQYGPDLKYTVTEKDVNLETAPIIKDQDELLRTFGRYENEKEFADAPPEFLTFARSEWLKYNKEKLGE